MTTYAASEPQNRILTGDMNAWPDQTSIAQYDTLYNDSGLSRPTARPRHSPGTTATKSGRIDYIFYSKQAGNLTVLSSQIIDTRDANGVTPSDHAPC